MTSVFSLFWRNQKCLTETQTYMYVVNKVYNCWVGIGTENEHVTDFRSVSSFESQKSSDKTRSQVGTCTPTGRSKGSYTDSKSFGSKEVGKGRSRRKKDLKNHTNDEKNRQKGTRSTDVGHINGTLRKIFVTEPQVRLGHFKVPPPLFPFENSFWKSLGDLSSFVYWY